LTGIATQHVFMRKTNNSIGTLRPAKIPLTNMRPFLSAVMLTGNLSNRRLAEALIVEAEPRVRTAGHITREVLDGPSITRRRAFFIASILYREATAPTWGPDIAQFRDVSHHFAWIVVRDHRAALVASDGAMRDSIVTVLASATVIGRDDAFFAFVGSKARTVWLNGTHAQTNAKPDAKVLMGTALEDALDPLGDHSYQLSALRSQPLIPSLSSRSIGVALAAGRVWSVRTQSLDELLSDIGALFDRLDNASKRKTKYDFLSQPISNTNDVSHAYAVSVMPAPLLDPSGTHISLGVITEGQSWAYESRYRVTSGNGPDFNVEVVHRGSSVGTLSVAVRQTKVGGKLRLESAGWQPVDLALKELRNRAESYLLDEHQVKIHYDSGHTITGGQCFRGGFVDQLVDWRWQDFSGFSINQEKPVANPTLADAIGLPSDNSLFGFVVRSKYRQGWLTCDDGASEAGDFVHLDPGANRVTLIHVKAASSQDPAREFSVSDFDLVIAQSIRNIRHLDKVNLLKALKKSERYSIASATWHNGIRATRSQFINEISKLGVSFSKELVVLQPQLTKAMCVHCTSSAVSKSLELRFKQINSLVQGAAMAAFGVGAAFTAYACE
jgi:hypothetical protein